MKYLIRMIFFNTFALWLTSQMLPFFVIGKNWQAILLGGFVLTLLMFIVKPILAILFIPITIMTFGLLSWAINVIVIYLLTIIEPSVKILSWSFPGATYFGFVIPPMEFTYLLSLVAGTLVLTCITNFLRQIGES